MDDREEPKADDHVEDLNLPEGESEDVKGGALNAYIPVVQGEKQGKFKGGVAAPSDIITGAGPGGGPH
jgi:hypothetical protein